MFEKIVDIQTGKEILREYTKEELEEVRLAKLKAEERLRIWNEQQEKRQSALAKLAALGLTEDEIAAL